MGKIDLIYSVMSQVYTSILRDLLIKAVDDPDSEIDDFIVKLVDRVFNYGA